MSYLLNKFQDIRKHLQIALKLFFLLVSLNFSGCHMEIVKISLVITYSARKLTFLQVKAGRSLKIHHAHTALSWETQAGGERKRNTIY